MKTSSKKWQKIRKIKGLRQFVTWYPRHVSENPGYMLLALEQRKDEDNRTLGEIFFYLTDELTDITFGESFQIILRAMFEGIYAVFQVTEEQIDTFINIFVDQLPDFLQKSLARSAAWA